MLQLAIRYLIEANDMMDLVGMASLQSEFIRTFILLILYNAGYGSEG